MIQTHLFGDVKSQILQICEDDICKSELQVFESYIKATFMLSNNKYMIASTQITNTEVYAFISVLDFALLSRKVLFINRKDNRNC